MIYFFKTIHHHLVSYGRDGVDKADFTRKLVASRNLLKNDVNINRGLAAFEEGNYTLALEIFTLLLKHDPFNSLLYSKRAETYKKLDNNWEALCDCIRAVALDKKSAENCLEAARLYLHFSYIDKAEDMNKTAMKNSSDSSIIKSYNQLQQDIEAFSLQGRSKSRNKERDNTSVEKVEEKENEPPEDGLPMTEYIVNLSNGSSAYWMKQYNKAIESYQNAMNLLSKYGAKVFNVEDKDVMVLHFVYGLACIRSSNLNNVQNAIDKFLTILRSPEPFLAVYYGLGEAYFLLNRIEEARQYLKLGLEKLKNIEQEDLVKWPQSSKSIDETNHSKLLKLMKDRLEQCTLPSKSDTICPFHLDAENSSREILYNYPDYKGSVILNCSAKCVLTFHSVCWKLYKQGLTEKYLDKDILDKPCPTSGCWGLIRCITIEKPGIDKKRKFISSSMNERPMHIPRPMVKTRTDNPEKLQKKAEKKRLRKERKMEVKLQAQQQQEVQKLEEEKLLNGCTSVPEEEVQLRVADHQVTVLKKDLEEKSGGKHKSSKPKKKKEKVKNILAVDFQFKGDEEKTRYSAYSVDDVQTSPTVYINPGLLPLPGTGPMPLGDGLLPAPAAVDNCTEDLFQFFLEFVKSEGSIELEGETMTNMVQSLPPEATRRIEAFGGISQFLASNSNFVIKNKTVSLLATEVAVVAKNPFSWEERKRAFEAANSQKPAAETKPEVKTEIKVTQPRTLNPAAKEFYPPSSSLRSSYSDINTLDMTNNMSGDSGITSLDVDNGFTMVRSKKSNHTRLAISETPVSAGSQVDVARQLFKSTPLHVDDEKFEQNTEGFCEFYNLADKPGPAKNISGRDSDTSDLSAEDFQKSDSPVLSINSSSSSGLRSAKDSHPLPKPLKIPKIQLASRGKKKSLHGHLTRSVPSVFGQVRPPSAESSVASSNVADDDDVQSITSTQSDKDSLSEAPRQSPVKTTSGWIGVERADNPFKTEIKESDLPFPGFLTETSSSSLYQRPQNFSPTVTNISDDQTPVKSRYRDIFSTEQFPASIWGVTDIRTPDAWPDKNFFPSFTLDSSVPSLSGDTIMPAATVSKAPKESRVLKLLETKTAPSITWTKSDPTDWPELSPGSFFDPPAPDFHFTSEPENSGCLDNDPLSSTPTSNCQSFSSSTLDPMDRPVLACKGPWIPPPDIPVTNSPLLQPSILAPLNTSAMGWMLSGLRSSLDSPLAASDMNLPAGEYQLKLEPNGNFSRTPGKKNPFSVNNGSSRPERRSLFKNSQCNEPFFPLSRLEESSSEYGTRDASFQTAWTELSQLSAGSQTDLTSEVLGKFLDNYHREKNENRLYKEAMKEIQEKTALILRLQSEKDKLIETVEFSQKSLRQVKLEKDMLRQENQTLKAKLEAADSRLKEGAENKLIFEKEKKAAHLKVLELSMALALKDLELKRVDANMHIQKLGALIKKGENTVEGSEGLQELKKKSKEWTEYMKLCDAQVDETSVIYSEKIELLNQKVPISELEPLILTPPTPPSPPSDSFSNRQIHFREINDDIGIKASAKLDMIFKKNTEKEERVDTPRVDSPRVDSPRFDIARISSPKNISLDKEDLIETNGLSQTSSGSSSPSLSAGAESPTRQPLALNPRNPAIRPVFRPITRGAPLRPLKSVATVPRPSSSLNAQPQTSFEKLVQRIQETFPSSSRTEIQKIISQLRSENGGSLSRFTEDLLTRHIAERIIEKDAATSQPTSKSNELSTSKVSRTVSDNTCTICRELINYNKAQTLDCSHRFHEHCIKKWFEEERSCPNCRSFVLPKDEYPTLR
ncbi:uncharacterized protein LOC131931932 isoform X2 [Physella acuta]|nr:uncharacterized protein LOC131931932 isoform X2 [Physella acuta]XP_059144750.1 uncharacterized protein LOC131931932 isoform X2 [Physella acuta]